MEKVLIHSNDRKMLSICQMIIFLVLFFLTTTPLFPQYLNPGNFTSLGSFNPASNVVINMNTRSMTGGASGTAVMSGSILVFTFDSFTLPSGISITFSNVTDNDDKIAFLSKGDITISGNIYANASGSTPGPGGRRGGIGNPAVTFSPEAGQGTGGGQIILGGDDGAGAGGGGFGGAGGAHGYGAPGGIAYGNLAVALDGGSGGARSKYDQAGGYGGGGGGALELGAFGTITLNSGCNVEAKGAGGTNSNLDQCGNDGDGGGSGGGILIHAKIITFNSGANVNANGGNGGNGDDDGTHCYASPGINGEGGSGGSGGGGRIRFAYYTSGTNNGNTSVSAGTVDPAEFHAGVAGSSGVIQFVQDANVPIPVPEMNLKQGTTAIADGGSYDYGTQTTGSYTDIIFTIENTGTGDLTLSGSPIISITGTNANQFSVQSQPTSPVSGSGTTTFTIRFSPTSGGAKTAAIAIGNNDSNENPYNLTLNGTVTPVITFVNGANAGLNFLQTPPSNPLPNVNWLCGQFSIAGDITGATLNSVTVTLGGTYNPDDLSSTPFQLYASNTNDFSTSSALGSSVADPGSGSDVTFSSLSDAIPSSTRYYWVTADISANAKYDDTMHGTIDAAGDLSITSGTLSGSSAYGKLNAGTDASLPVELSSFSARSEGQSIIVEWMTESESDNLGFILERSLDGESWTTIASWQTNEDLRGQGSISSKSEYAFTDNDVESGMAYEYRLSDVSLEGQVTVYASLSMTLDALPEVTEMEKAYPNPFNPSTFISYHLAEDSQIEISVFDMLGRKVQTLYTGQQYAGSYHVYWNGKHETGHVAPTGTYLIRMQTENIVQTQKVLLMK